MSFCPYCGDEAEDVRAEIAHMRDHHPEVIKQRLELAGIHEDEVSIYPLSRQQSIRDAVLTLKDAAIKDGVSDDVAAAIAFLDLLTR